MQTEKLSKHDDSRKYTRINGQWFQAGIASSERTRFYSRVLGDKTEVIKWFGENAMTRHRQTLFY